MTTTQQTLIESPSLPIPAWNDIFLSRCKTSTTTNTTKPSLGPGHGQRHHGSSSLFVSGSLAAPPTQRLLVFVRAVSPQDATSVRLRASPTMAYSKDISSTNGNWPVTPVPFSYVASFRNKSRVLERSRSMADLMVNATVDEIKPEIKNLDARSFVMRLRRGEPSTPLRQSLASTTSSASTSPSTSITSDSSADSDFDSSLSSIQLPDAEDGATETIVHEYDPSTTPQPISSDGEESELTWEWNGDLCDDSTDKKRMKQKREIRKQRRDMVEYVKSLRRQRRKTVGRDEERTDLN